MKLRKTTGRTADGIAITEPVRGESHPAFPETTSSLGGDSRQANEQLGMGSLAHKGEFSPRKPKAAGK
jgi:hypothetical protein